MPEGVPLRISICGWRQRSAATADGRDCRGAQAGQHDAAVSVPRTLSRGVRELTAASGGCREADEGKTTSRQEGIYIVAVCDDCFSGP